MSYVARFGRTVLQMLYASVANGQM